MSAAEDDTELRDLLIQNLENSGVLNKLKAEMRAAVFLAMEEQDRLENKTPLVNENLKKCLNSKDGRLVAGLIVDFLQVFNLDFSLSVFQPEINSLNGLDSRDSVCRDLCLSESELNRKSPLLLELVRRGRHRDQSTVSQCEQETRGNIPKEPSQKQISAARKTFDVHDKNKSGSVLKDDLKSVFTDLFPGLNKNMLERFVADELKAADKSFSKTVDFQLFLGIYRRLFTQCRSVVVQESDDVTQSRTEDRVGSPPVSKIPRYKGADHRGQSQTAAKDSECVFGKGDVRGSEPSSSSLRKDRLDLDLEAGDEPEEGDSFFDDPLPKPQKTYGCLSALADDDDLSEQSHSSELRKMETSGARESPAGSLSEGRGGGGGSEGGGRGAGGGGGVVAVVRCSCVDEEVKISFRNVGNERRLRRVFIHRWLESPRLSTASISSNERAPSDSSDLPSARRPVSLVSTLSSGSGSSRDDLAPPPARPLSSDPDVDLDLSPPEGRQPWPLPSPDRKGRSLNSSSMAPNPQLTYLDRVVMEIIETERMYVRDLRMIVEDYLAHIIDQSDLSIRPEQVCSLFGNIEDIYEFNSELLQSLDLCDNDPVAVARCFVMKSEYFEIYTQYCTNYPNSVAALTECMRNKSLGKFFRERQASLKRSLPLGSYLLKPVQRILKYHLLLQEIAKHFDPEEEGYEVVEEAIYTMTGVAWYINDMKRKHEHAVRLQEVQSLMLNWKGPDLTTYGELVLEGTFKVHRAKNERTLFLFDRMLLITKRRGEHYAYKTHISCSTLMLIESAKDSLSFSVTHYKHPKQPHTVQAKTVEEKKLWAHHIKRIILENHHAIIPQKAKEAILEMDSIYPLRYAERLNKAPPPRQADGRQGRRQSEPSRQILRSSKGSDGALPGALLGALPGALPGETPPLQPTASSSTLGESELERPAEEEEEGRKRSVQRQSCSDEEEEEEEEEERRAADSDPDDLLLEDDQVADFASSLLAAISCWHYRAQALLSSGVAMVTEAEAAGVSSNGSNKVIGVLPAETGATEPTGQQKQPQEKPSESEPSENPEPEPPARLSTTPPRISASPQQTEPLKPKADLEPVEEPSSATPDSDSKTLSSGESSEDEEGEKEAAEASSILPSSVLDKASAIAQHFNNSVKRGSLVQDEARSPSCTSPRLPSRTGSSVSLSAERLPSRTGSSVSLSADRLPSRTGSSVSLSADRLPSRTGSSVSLSADRLPSRTGSSVSLSAERLPSRTGSSVSLSADRLPSRTGSSVSLSAERLPSRTGSSVSLSGDRLPSSTCSDLAETFGATDLTLLSLQDDGLFERSIQRRRDSMLSKQDQLLIGKIKSYYENAGNQDATFSLQRRESLTYIPTGLVRSSVSRLNSMPKDKPSSSSGLEPSSDSALPSETRGHMVSSDSSDSMKSGQRSTEPEDSGERSRSHSVPDNPAEDEEFRPSSEMIKIWQAMEQQITRSDDRGRDRCREASRSCRTISEETSSRTRDQEGAASDLGTIAEESRSLSPPKHKASAGVNRAGGLKDSMKVCRGDAAVLRAAGPRVARLKAEAEAEPPSEDEQDDVDKAKSKVLHLARQYSQRIRTTKPVARQRSHHGALIRKKSLPCVVEEMSGKSSLILPLASLDLGPSLPLSPVDQVRSPSPGPACSPGGRARSRSPLSPPPPTEGFNWPDVRELRTKYTVHSRSPMASVTRSLSIPEQMFDGGLRRHSSASPGPLLPDTPPHRPLASRDAARKERSNRLQRANSLDPRLSGAQLSELQNLQDQVSNSSYAGYYVAAEAPMQSDPEHKIIVMEKLPPPESETAKETTEEDDSYVQIRSPTSKEKISIMAVIDRCRAYQDSDEYRQREEARARSEPARPAEGDVTAAGSCDDQDGSQQSIVKNLREKFQSLS
ncbi:pleckstrin homology domain-containing family G member 3-like [Scomber scombrus]|uniref:pleckstrin homology domain-containing family G member 3-like n=1 Tax=Scomber scombrus TaxID=13677 RepID=UPI002DDB12CA|nr:pleckstrin homology domain-containing family G member 3-like [Scomber scombrus]